MSLRAAGVLIRGVWEMTYKNCAVCGTTLPRFPVSIHRRYCSVLCRRAQELMLRKERLSHPSPEAIANCKEWHERYGIPTWDADAARPNVANPCPTFRRRCAHGADLPAPLVASPRSGAAPQANCVCLECGRHLSLSKGDIEWYTRTSGACRADA